MREAHKRAEKICSYTSQSFFSSCVVSACREGRAVVAAVPWRRLARPHSIAGMAPSLPTTLAVSDAVTHYRRIRELTIDELSYVLLMLGHELSTTDIAAIENRTRPATVDDLIALSHALNTSPAVMLSHIPIDLPYNDGPLGTGLPYDVDHLELRAWLEGRTTLDRQTRIEWWTNRVMKLRLRSVHHEEQLTGAQLELHSIGELAVREAEMPPVKRLHLSAGAVAFDAPLFIAQGKDDELVLPADTQTFVDHEKSLGIDVTFHEVAGATHGTIAYLTLPALESWLDAHG